MPDAVPNPEEDINHAHALLSRMSPEELLRATFALEAIVEQSPQFQEKMRKEIAAAEASGWATMEEVLADHGLTIKDIGEAEPSAAIRNEAA